MREGSLNITSDQHDSEKQPYDHGLSMLAKDTHLKIFCMYWKKNKLRD